jgi:SAM-dependent methyltransferase
MIRTLKTGDELVDSRRRLRDRGADFASKRRLFWWRIAYLFRFQKRLPIPDTTKSWDVENSVELISRLVPDKGAPILDMGCFNSEILYALLSLGYGHLNGCDLDPRCRWMAFWNRIRYQVADLTRTPYPESSFSAITCLSVVEHGVPLEALVREVRRLLRAGGLFILTTDYDGTGQSHAVSEEFRAFGAPWTLFDKVGLHGIVHAFTGAGFELLDAADVDDTHSQTPISWNGQKYTFALVALRAPAARVGQRAG